MFGKVQTFSSIVQYVSLQREEKNNNTRKTAFGPVRCLFGVPDRNETKNLIDQELKKQKDEFFERWDIENIEMCVDIEETRRKRKLENDENVGDVPSAKRLSFDNDKLPSICTIVPRRILQPRNGLQSHITDFWTSKKPVMCEEQPLQKHSTKYLPQQHKHLSNL